MLIKKLKLILMVSIVADIITLIFYYPEIYQFVFNLGLNNYGIIELVLRPLH